MKYKDGIFATADEKICNINAGERIILANGTLAKVIKIKAISCYDDIFRGENRPRPDLMHTILISAPEKDTQKELRLEISDIPGNTLVICYEPED